MLQRLANKTALFYDIIGWLRFIKQKKALVYYKDDDDWTAVEFIVNNKHRSRS